jgi:hypothetical protein
MHGEVVRPFAFALPLTASKLCKARSIPRFGGPGEVSALSKYGVGWDAAVNFPRMARWETHAIFGEDSNISEDGRRSAVGAGARREAVSLRTKGENVPQGTGNVDTDM